MFKLIDKNSWKRRDRFDYYYDKIRCTYSVTVNLDVTPLIYLKEKGLIKIYPALIYALTKVVNNHEEFRVSFDESGQLGVWDELLPSYTVFHKEDETFSDVWTEWDNDFNVFFANYKNDIDIYGDVREVSVKAGAPQNVFPISALPWVSFTGFNLNIYADGSYLLPIFTLGKYFTENGRFMIPLSVQVHHAVCDGFHVSRLINEVQLVIDDFVL